MKIVARNIPISPSLNNPLGEYTHLVIFLFRHEDDEPGVAPAKTFCLYSKKDNSLSQVTEDYAAEIALAEAMRDAETSVPQESCQTSPTVENKSK